MKKNFLTKLAVPAFAAAALAGMGSMTMTAHAAKYHWWISRGLDGFSSVRTDFDWTVDSRYNITGSSAYQTANGFLASANGCCRTYTSLLEHDWVTNCGPTANIGIGGVVTIPFGYQFKDKVVLFNSGGSRVDWNAG